MLDADADAYAFELAQAQLASGMESKSSEETWLDLVRCHVPRDHATCVELVNNPQSIAGFKEKPRKLVMIALIMLKLDHCLFNFESNIDSDEVLSLFLGSKLDDRRMLASQVDEWHDKIVKLKAHRTALAVAQRGHVLPWDFLCDLLSFRDPPSPARSLLVKWLVTHPEVVAVPAEAYRETFKPLDPDLDLTRETFLNARHTWNLSDCSRPFYVFILRADPVLASELLNTPHLRLQREYLANGAWSDILDCAYDYLNFSPGGNRRALIAIIQHIISLDPKRMSIRDQEFLSKHPIFAFDPVE
jgi:hypothetical protein